MDALRILYPQIVTTNGDVAYDANGNEVQYDKAALEAYFKSQEYKFQRQAEYPSLQEQLDMQYWDSVNGTTTWQDAINAVKAKYPKG
jgi:hypothetical protein